ncbi:hypothetical protein R9C00_24205 [Flammeovirgaceae bacterium SG7u.111]|nr:hypothetical protein [Flammeovirgaceae bacterium SG7u.132]WPO34805.1 hypothetical protein R9C00_24205 [Flammeovirgaceae bacterium SG7u.111]
MTSPNINSWKVPEWHTDFGDPYLEFSLLKEIAVFIKKNFKRLDVYLECIEEDGYLNLEVYKDANKKGEIYANQDGSRFKISAFIFTENDEIECHTFDVEELFVFMKFHFTKL